MPLLLSVLLSVLLIFIGGACIFLYVSTQTLREHRNDLMHRVGLLLDDRDWEDAKASPVTARALTNVGARELETRYDGQQVSEFYVAPCMCIPAGQLENADCVRPKNLQVGETFSAGPRSNKWTVLEAPVPHKNMVCVYAEREEPTPLNHYFYFDPDPRIHANYTEPEGTR